MESVAPIGSRKVSVSIDLISFVFLCLLISLTSQQHAVIINNRTDFLISAMDAPSLVQVPPPDRKLEVNHYRGGTTALPERLRYGYVNKSRTVTEQITILNFHELLAKDAEIKRNAIFNDTMDAPSLVQVPHSDRKLQVNGESPLPKRLRYDDDYYTESIQIAEQIIRSTVHEFYQFRSEIASALLRLLFHEDHGCDISVLDPTATTEKEDPTNESLKGFDMIDMIKLQVEETCPGVVSCSDIVVSAARESVLATGGPLYPLSTQDHVNRTLPISNNKGFNEKESLVYSCTSSTTTKSAAVVRGSSSTSASKPAAGGSGIGIGGGGGAHGGDGDDGGDRRGPPPGLGRPGHYINYKKSISEFLDENSKLWNKKGLEDSDDLEQATGKRKRKVRSDKLEEKKERFADTIARNFEKRWDATKEKILKKENPVLDH